MGLFNPDGKFMRAMTKVFYLLVTGLFWLIGSITVVGIGPVTTALYYSTTKSVRRDRGSPISEFFRALKDNWLKSLIAGVMLLLLGLSTYLTDYNYIVELITCGESSNKLLLILAIVKLFLVLGLTIYLFPILSRFQVKLPKAFLVCIGLMFRHLGWTLVMIVLLSAAVLIAIAFPVFCWMVPGFYMFLLSYPMEKILRRYVAEEETIASEDNDPWYMEK